MKTQPALRAIALVRTLRHSSFRNFIGGEGAEMTNPVSATASVGLNFTYFFTSTSAFSSDRPPS